VEEGLDTALIAALAVSLIAWGLVSARLAALDVSSAMFFVVLGLVLANEPVSAINVEIDSETLKSLAEVTLALLLFSDAARINQRVLRHDAGIPLRLLVGGLPLTIALGTAFAVLLFPDLDPWAAAAIAAAVAPTDAALGAQVVSDRNVPGRIRRTLNVESGLNDGIATPFVTFFVAGAVANTVSGSSVSLGGSLGDLATGVLVGIGVGFASGLLLTWSTSHGWSAPTYRGIAALATALAAYALAIELGGNGFIGAFVGGIAFGAGLSGGDRDPTLEFDAHSGAFLSLVVWFLFGAAMLPALENVTWQTVVFAVLALTVVRLVPVALVLIGCGFTPVTVAFIGWFGPRAWPRSCSACSRSTPWTARRPTW
jgi:NhaP-type Na+/H+ or K+/H+ antiporter